MCTPLPIEQNQNAFAACTHLMTQVKWNLSDFRYSKYGLFVASCFEECLAAIFLTDILTALSEDVYSSTFVVSRGQKLRCVTHEEEFLRLMLTLS